MALNRAGALPSAANMPEPSEPTPLFSMNMEGPDGMPAMMTDEHDMQGNNMYSADDALGLNAAVGLFAALSHTPATSTDQAL